jgi:site-specific DNA-methyltransferase (adenine-specific)/adenine-specific DNA-methyltransferase
MPTLDWIGKQAVVGHHRRVPYRLLHCDKKLSAGDPDAGNLLVQGDNLEALKALLPYYAGQVKCIYIDPPYNTGNEGWVYNDNVNSPEIRRWLGEVVGKEAEDLSRHDKWLCMMYPRLALLRDFLARDGAIFVSIDDNEGQVLRLLMDELFGRRAFVATLVWQKRTSRENRKAIGSAHDYIYVYSPLGAESWKHVRNKLPPNDKGYSNPDNDARGPWRSIPFSAQGFRTNQMYDITTPTGKVLSQRGSIPQS